MVEVEEHLPSKCRALSSNPSTTKNYMVKKKTQKSQFSIEGED
jgi:hypothetical protein